jgi:hypothetical protein
MSDNAFQDTEDSDPSNVMTRAGYLRGLAMRMEDEFDKEFLLKASRSLIAYAELVRYMAR